MANIESGNGPSSATYAFIDGGSDYEKSVPNFDFDGSADSRSYYRGSNGKLTILPVSVSQLSMGLPKPTTAKDDIVEQKKKEEKKAAKLLYDKLKINMANERTFTKWLLAGMQMGAIGTFVMLSLDRKNNVPWGVVTLLFPWIIGFGIALYGMFSYYGRRKAMETGDFNRDPAAKCSWVPFVIILTLSTVVVTSLVYVGVAGIPAHQAAKAHTPATLH